MRRAHWIAAAAAAAVLAGGLGIEGRWAEALAALLVGAAWVGGVRRGWGWAASAGFLALLGLASLGVLGGMPPGWALLAATAALAAWDLAWAGLRLEGGVVVGEAGIVRAHLLRLAAVCGAGLAAGGLAVGVQLPVSFGWLLLLGLVALAGVAGGVRALRRPLEDEAP